MNQNKFVPGSLKLAARELRNAFASIPSQMPRRDFVRVWSSVAYLFPNLHPDGYNDSESGWPRVLKPFAEEAWRRADASVLSDEELYPSDAQWSGLFDRMHIHLPEELKRRMEIAFH